MGTNKYAMFFAAYNASVKKGNPYTKEEVIAQFTQGRTTSLKELSPHQLLELVRTINQLAGNKASADKADSMRKAIISIFKQMNRTAADAKAWCEKQGVKHVKKPFNSYNTQELYILIIIAEKVLADWHHAIRQAINKTN